MESICIILRKPPYGSVDTAEAVRHALGAAIEDMDVRLILLDSGINAAKKGQNVAATGYLSVETGIMDCIDMGVKVYSDRASFKESNWDAGEIIGDVTILSSYEIAEILLDSDVAMIF